VEVQAYRNGKVHRYPWSSGILHPATCILHSAP